MATGITITLLGLFLIGHAIWGDWATRLVDGVEGVVT